MNSKDFETLLMFYEVTGPFLQAIHQPINEPLTKLFEQEGASEGADGIYAQVSAAVYPKESLIADLIARSPYTNQNQILPGLRESEERGWITLSQTGFTATRKSLNLSKKIIAMLTKRSKGFEAYQLDIATAVDLLGKLVEGAERVGLGTKPTFSYARKYEYEDKTPSLIWVRRHILTLAAYRDDCHMDAWMSQLKIPGYVFEALTLLWRGDANTAAALAETLPYRNFTEEDYAYALSKLTRLGWVESMEDGFIITEEGQALRDEVEARTDKNYQAAFAVLSEDQLDQLIHLIKKLTAVITPEKEITAQQS